MSDSARELAERILDECGAEWKDPDTAKQIASWITVALDREKAKAVAELKATGPCGKHPKACHVPRHTSTTICKVCVTESHWEDFCTICAEQAEREKRIIFELHHSHRRAGDFNFAVRATIGDLTIEEMDNFRKMLVTAIGTAEDMFRRGIKERNPAQSALAADAPAEKRSSIRQAIIDDIAPHLD